MLSEVCNVYLESGLEIAIGPHTSRCNRRVSKYYVVKTHKSDSAPVVVSRCDEHRLEPHKPPRNSTGLSVQELTLEEAICFSIHES